MPQVDMESLVDRTSLTVGRRPASQEDVVGDANYHVAYGSVEVPTVGWSLGYRVYDREESTKGATNPKSNAKFRFASCNLNVPPPVASKNKPPIIALPRAKIQEASAYDGRSVRRPTQCRFFPKDKLKKRPTAREAEPGSPKVSCVGKVLSERDRCRWRREDRNRKERGSWTTLFFCFRGSGGTEGGVVDSSAAPAKRQGLNNYSSSKGGAAAAKTERGSSGAELCDDVVVPGLDAMKRFSSGRRAPSPGEGKAPAVVGRFG